MRNRFRESFSDSPIAATEGERIQGAFYVAFALGALGLVIQGALARQPHTILGAGVFGGVVLLSWGLGRRGHHAVSRLLLPATAVVLTTALAWRSNGIHDIAILFYPIVVIFSGLLLGVGATIIFAVICSAAAMFLVWADINGFNISPAAANSDYADALAVTIMLALSASLMRFVILSLNRTLGTLRSREAALAESNRSLEAQADEIRRSEARWRSLTENAPDRIMNVAPDGTIVFANVIVGERLEGPMPANVYEMVAAEDHALLRSALRSAFSEAAPSTCELRGARDDCWWSARLGPIDGEGDVTGATLILSDISDRKRAEDAPRNLES